MAALGLFVALIAGWSLRPQFAAAELPEPVAWTHGTQSVQAHASYLRLRAAEQSISYRDHASAHGATPTNKKPFHSTWMARDRPTGWTPLSPQSGWLASLSPFAVSESQLPGAHWVEPMAAGVNRDMLTQLCVSRC